MKSFSSCLILLLFFTLSLYSQNGAPPSSGARGIGMGGVGLTFKDINSLFANPAGLSYLEGVAATVMAEERFLVAEIKSVSAGGAIPTQSGTYGLSLNYLGFEGYNEQRLGLAYSRKLLESLSIGGQFIVLNTRIPEYGSNIVATFELGFLLGLFPNLDLGFHVFSPLRVNILPDEQLPTVFRLGLGYQPSEKVKLLAEVEKDIDYLTRVKMGLDYKIIKPLYLRLGMATEPTLLSFGLGLQLESGLLIDVASQYHQVLGFTPAISLTYQGSKKE
ncbi:MAG TPA: hypothetical protein PKA00_19880 [Saprospiraceae bacterium]|nr:hypothetical protein [Saprospiraceae bacterium]HMQ85180.1 hypothetical protein [Saprospiraceae bacterium]